jgi:hypothetical protein
MADQIVLYIIGLGVVIPGHISIQATRAMSECSELFSIVQEPSGLWMPVARQHLTKVTNLLESYAEGRLRIENYERAVQNVINALAPGRSVGYVTYGNPMSYDRVAQELLQHAKEHDLAVKVIPGISSIDSLLCDIGLDMAPAIQIFDATWLVACGIEPIIKVPMLLVQAGCFGSLRTHYSKRQDGKSLTELVAYLYKFYLPTHAVILVCSTAEAEHPAHIRKVDLERLCEVGAEDLSGASLYIPASIKPQFDPVLVTRMERN